MLGTFDTVIAESIYNRVVRQATSDSIQDWECDSQLNLCPRGNISLDVNAHVFGLFKGDLDGFGRNGEGGSRGKGGENDGHECGEQHGILE